MVKYSPRLIDGLKVDEGREFINLERLRKERADRLRHILKKYGIPACVIGQGVNARYATGIRCYMGCCLFFVEHEPVIWEAAYGQWAQVGYRPWLKPENQRATYFWEYGAAGEEASQSLARALATEIKQVLKEHGLEGEKLGVVGLDGYAMAALREQGLEMVSAHQMLIEARMIKTVDEINLWRIATTIADGAFYAVYEAIKPGARDSDIKAAAFKYVTDAGGDFGGFNVWSGPNTYNHSGAGTDRFIQVGDALFVDAVGTSYMGYFNCTYRNFMVGRKPNDREKDWFKRALDKQNRVIDAIRPGATTADVAKYLDPASVFNFPAEHYAFGLDVTHGIGMEVHEAPLISRHCSLEYPQPIEAGMCLAVEVICNGEVGEGGFRIEDHVLVTEDGPEIISGRFPRDEIVVACPII